MNLKNSAIYLGILLLVLCIGLPLQSAMIELNNSSFVTFSDASEIYLNELLTGIEDNNLNNVTEKTALEYQNDTIISEDTDTGEATVTDVLAQINLFGGFMQKVINPLKFIFGVPTFLLTLFGLPLTPFRPVWYVLNLVFYIGLVLMIKKELLG